MFSKNTTCFMFLIYFFVQILQALLCSQGPDNVDIRMKSTKRLSSLSKGSWFYIRGISFTIFMGRNSSTSHMIIIDRAAKIFLFQAYTCLTNSDAEDAVMLGLLSTLFTTALITTAKSKFSITSF